MTVKLMYLIIAVTSVLLICIQSYLYYIENNILKSDENFSVATKNSLRQIKHVQGIISRTLFIFLVVNILLTLWYHSF